MWAERHAAASPLCPESESRPLNFEKTGLVVFAGVKVLEGNPRNASFCLPAVISLHGLTRSR